MGPTDGRDLQSAEYTCRREVCKAHGADHTDAELVAPSRVQLRLDLQQLRERKVGGT